ncbi:Transcription factor bHLH162 [Vitis vinifera]|uniref:Transcription factor bHLH162 n=1 Tax=Vitis vinifera TaxID=29760 RepID=A0A438IGM5_VITVI|nr:Transcription factor bHLH162 [Vitis vinifera]
MKSLYSKLNSLVPHQTSREAITLPDQLDEAANYIKRLQEKLEKMKERKDNLMGFERPNTSPNSGAMVGLKPPQIDIHEKGSALEVVLITGLDFQFMFNETIRVLHEEVLRSSMPVEGPVLGHGAARISERLKKFVF